jgi:phage shock protein PspC (stress-responsive transcriptional regulator)/signal transduction histidine kinase
MSRPVGLGHPENPGRDPEIHRRSSGCCPDAPGPAACDDHGVDTRALGLDTSAELGPAADGSPRSRYRRRREDRLLAGVAGGLADHLGLNPLHVRIAFACLTGVAGFGVVLYGAFWVLIPQADTGAPVEPPGLAAASRRGLRRLPVRGPEPESIGQLVALLAVALGAVLALQQTGLGVDEVVLWPALAVVAGLAVVWWQVDESAPFSAPSSAPRRRRVLVVLRYVAGAVLVGLGLASFLLLAGGADAARRGLFGGAVLVGGAALIVGPWLLRTWRTLADERAERIRSQMHADLAAHLHDSVLQTLALIQRQAHDARAVTRLARAQERDLRTFLYGEAGYGGAPAGDTSTLAAALRRTAAEVEDAHGVAVEVVTVGDVPLDGPAGEARRALLAAAREAMVNAAVHAGTTVDVYVEADGDTVHAYVRDRGPGFDPDAVPEDRAGVRHSIVGRMERHGGRATLRSRPGEGTEVELRLGDT